MTFQTGHDFFGDLPSIGVATDNDRPALADIEAAWHKFGRAFLDQYTDNYVRPWALREFGEPKRWHDARS